MKTKKKFSSWVFFSWQVPKDASYSVTVTLEKKQAALKCNIPFTSLGAWVAKDNQEWMRTMR